METYATPLDRAKALLDEFVDYATAQSHGLPATRYAQIGEIVRDCESVIVSVGSLVPSALSDPVSCIYPRTATFLIDIIRACAVVYEEDGVTIVEALEEVSEQGSLDGQLLYDFAGQVDGWTEDQPWSVVWSIAEGGLQVASLQITIGIP